MTDSEDTLDAAFERAITEMREAREAVEALRMRLRYRSLTARDAAHIRRMIITVGNDTNVLSQLRDVAADRARREGTLA